MKGSAANNGFEKLRIAVAHLFTYVFFQPLVRG
jgi:hypothetical protein